MNITNVIQKIRTCSKCGLKTTIVGECDPKNTVALSLPENCPLCFVAHSEDVTTENYQDHRGFVLCIKQNKGNEKVILAFNTFSGVVSTFTHRNETYFLLFSKKLKKHETRESFLNAENKAMIGEVVDKVGLCCYQVDYPIEADIAQYLFAGYCIFNQKLQRMIMFGSCSPMKDATVVSNTIH